FFRKNLFYLNYNCADASKPGGKVGSFLVTILSEIPNSTHSAKDLLLCVCTSACFDCGQLKRLSR
ncbi:unnamed protein product, partial [Allacma fusca]